MILMHAKPKPDGTNADAKEQIIVVLDPENIRRIMAGTPAHINPHDFDPTLPDFELVFFIGDQQKTTQSMMAAQARGDLTIDNVIDLTKGPRGKQ